MKISKGDAGEVSEAIMKVATIIRDPVYIELTVRVSLYGGKESEVKTIRAPVDSVIRDLDGKIFICGEHT